MKANEKRFFTIAINYETRSILLGRQWINWNVVCSTKPAYQLALWTRKETLWNLLLGHFFTNEKLITKGEESKLFYPVNSSWRLSVLLTRI